MAYPLGVHILTLSRSQSLLAFWSPGQNSEVTEDWGPVGNRLPVTTRVRAIYRRSVWLFCDLLAISLSCCCLFASKMWENVPDFLELFRNFPVSISVLFVVPVVLLSGPSSTVMAAHEFPVFRMQQYDLHQTQVGKSTSVSIVKQRTRSWMVYLLANKVLMARLWFLCYKEFCKDVSCVKKCYAKLMLNIIFQRF